MAHEYSNPKRESDPYALPDIEVFHLPKGGGCAQYDGDGDALSPGYYWQACFPGCLPDGDPNGPFDTYAEALADARDGMGDDDD